MNTTLQWAKGLIGSPFQLSGKYEAMLSPALSGCITLLISDQRVEVEVNLSTSNGKGPEM